MAVNVGRYVIYMQARFKAITAEFITLSQALDLERGLREIVTFHRLYSKVE